jgi:hypothetical protein
LWTNNYKNHYKYFYYKHHIVFSINIDLYLSIYNGPFLQQSICYFLIDSLIDKYEQNQYYQIIIGILSLFRFFLSTTNHAVRL